MENAETFKQKGPIVEGVELSQQQIEWLDAGVEHFNAGRFWHAHEDWEELWKSLKSRNVDLDYDLGIQGLIQTTAFMFQYERMKKRGCLSMWSKLTEKLGTPDEAKFDNLWSIDIPLLLREVSVFIDDADSEEPKWNLQCSSVQIHNVNE